MRKIVFLFFFVSILFCEKIIAKEEGSNTQASRHLRTFFPASDENNVMLGFAFFEKGITFEDSTTTCSFDTLFPVSGDITLNGGTLYLLNNLELKYPSCLGSGIISSDYFSVICPGNIPDFYLPSQYHSKTLTMIDKVNVGAEVYSLSWSVNGEYLAVGTRSQLGNALQIYSFDGLTLEFQDSINFGSTNINSVAWHPSDYYLAVGLSKGTELQLYQYNTETESLSSTGSANIGGIYSLSWSYLGNHLAVGFYNKSYFSIYEISGGVPGDFYNGSFSENKKMKRNILSWNNSGEYIAVGLCTSPSDAELKVFYFDGSTVIENAEVELGVDVCSVSWQPGGSYIIVGKSSSSERMVLYQHDSQLGTLVEKTTARVGEGQTLYALDWSDDGGFVISGQDSTSDQHEVRLFAFNEEYKTFHLSSGYSIDSSVRALSMACDYGCIAVGDVDGSVTILKMVESSLTFNNTNVYLNSNLTVNETVIFKGDCSLYGGGKILNFESGGSIIIADGSTLSIENIQLNHVVQDSIANSSDSSVLYLSDVLWYQDSVYTFSIGGLIFDNEVVFSGASTFAYSSVQTTTILSKSSLTLDCGFTFSYDPIYSDSKNLLEFIDNSSHLILQGATLHATSTGMQLKKGTLVFRDESYIVSEKGLLGFQDSTSLVKTEYLLDEGITVGDSSQNDNCICQLDSGVRLSLLQGSFIYKNVIDDAWIETNGSTKFYLKENTRLKLEETLDLGSTLLFASRKAHIMKSYGKNLIGTVVVTE